MKIEEPETMKELRKIRETLGQKYRDLPPEQQAQQLQEEGEEILRKYKLGLRYVSSTPHRPASSG